MLTFFTTGKPFKGHSGIIQRNALRSWTLLHPDVEVILFGDDEGAGEICAELGLHHESHMQRHQNGMKYLNYMFERAQAIARHSYLCYSNCDIVFGREFLQAFAKVTELQCRFLMVGQRWDTDISEPIDFSREGWDVALKAFARNTGFRQKRHFIDFFLFTKNLYDEVPPLVVGRSWWDHWLVWKALHRHAVVIDCSSAVVAVHQNHGYGYHPQGKEGTNEDELALQNKRLAGNGRHLRTTADATHVLTSRGNIRRAPFHKLAVQTLPNLANKVIFNTLWIRKPLGLQRRNLEKLMRAIHFKM